MKTKMNLKQSIQYLEAEKEIFDKTECEACGRVQKVIYSVGTGDDDCFGLCGRCLVKHANSYKEFCEGGVV